jgi:hypothetical protein
MFIHDVREVNIPLEKFNEMTGYKFEAKRADEACHAFRNV